MALRHFKVCTLQTELTSAEYVSCAQLRVQFEEGLRPLSEKPSHPGGQSVTELAAVEEYLKILKDTDYTIWYWKDRREVLVALEIVIKALEESKTIPAFQHTCVSHGNTWVYMFW